jgi:hypothetical protein
MSIAKKEAKRLIEKLPDQVTWDDIMYEFYVTMTDMQLTRKKISEST